MTEHFDFDHIHTTREGRHFRHGDGQEVSPRTAREIGIEIGRAIARDVLAGDLPREWTGLDAQDADRIPDGVDRDEVEAAAEAAYLDMVDGLVW